jgi:TolB-like protein
MRFRWYRDTITLKTFQCGRGLRMESGIVKFGHFELDCDARELRRNGRRTRLQEQPFQVLRQLIQVAGQVVMREELRAQLWPANVLVDFDRGLNNAIAKLREVLGDSPERPRYIETIPRLGYRFVFPLDSNAAQPLQQLRGPSLAVLPFSNLDNDPEQDYFVDGMMEEIVIALTRIRSLLVIDSRSTLSLKGRAPTPQNVARQLGVRYILEGSVRRANSRIRVGVKLTDVRGGTSVWAERFEGTLEDVFLLQDHVALAVAGIIEPNIQSAELRRIVRKPLENLGSYDLYLRAARLRATLRKAEVIQALEFLRRAIELEPLFAPALAQAAGCHSQVCFNGWDADLEAHRREGLALVDRAVAAGSDDAAVLAQAANAVMDLDRNCARASELIERAIALNPGSAYAWFISGLLKLADGQYAGAMERLQRAARLDPISPVHEGARAHIAVINGLCGNFEGCVRVLKATSYRSPRIHLALLHSYGRLGRWDEAREELRSYEQLATIPAEQMVASMPIEEALRRSLLADIAHATTG